MFEGHQIYSINKFWVFDLTTFIGYTVELDEADQHKVSSFDEAFVMERDNESGAYSFIDFTNVPLRIKNAAVRIVQRYRKEALLS